MIRLAKLHIVFILLAICGSVDAQQEWDRFSLSDEDSKSRATRELELLVSDLDFGVRDCLCDWRISVESSTDSEFLFVSKGHLKLFRSQDDVIWTSCEWEKETLADDRPEPRSRSLLPTCDFEQIVVNGKFYNNKSKTLKPDLTNSRLRFAECPIVNPLNVPFLHPVCLVAGESCNGAKAFFGGLMKCVATSSMGKALESVWLDMDKKGESFAFCRTKCIDGLPERFEFVIVPNGFKIEKGLPSKKECRIASSVETKWGTFEGSSVPVSCFGTMSPPTKGFGIAMLYFEASMKYHDRHSREFREKDAELQPVIEIISKREKSSNGEKTGP